jgi:hypothetical protein
LQIPTLVAALVRSLELSATEYDPSRVRYFSWVPELAVDHTGVGVAVTITGGDRAHKVKGTWRVPKRDLAAALEVPSHTGKLKRAEGLESPRRYCGGNYSTSPGARYTYRRPTTLTNTGERPTMMISFSPQRWFAGRLGAGGTSCASGTSRPATK